MRYIKLGNTGLDVSPIALGCMTYGDPARGHPAWSLAEGKAGPVSGSSPPAPELGLRLKRR